MAGLARRRWYKPERAPARTKGVLHDQAPIACPDANPTEIAMALFALCESAGVAPGRGGTYDSLRDEYTIVAKVLDGGIDADGMPTGKAQDVKVQGLEVALLINMLRSWNGVKRFDKQGLTKAVAG